MAADMVHTLIMRAPDPQGEEWRLRRLWITPITPTSATVASVVLGDTLVICIAGSQPDKVLDWIININHSDGLYDAATREKFPNLLFHQGMLADVGAFLSRFGSTAREDAETASGEDGKQEKEEDEDISSMRRS